MKLKNRKNFIRYTPEENAPRRMHLSLQFTRVVYLIFFGAILIVLTNWAINKWISVEGQGLVMLKSVTLRAVDDIKIEDFLVEEGEDVLRGQTLLQAVSLDGAEIIESKDRGPLIEKTKRDVEERLIAERSLKQEIKAQQDHIARLKRLNALEWRMQKELYDAQRKLRSYELERRKINSEIRMLQDRIEALDEGNYSQIIRPLESSMQSPFQGQVVEIKKNDGEVALRGEELISILGNEDINIKAFFPLQKMPRVTPGAKVSIHFPDGSKGYGTVNQYYYSTLPLPEEFQSRYEPVQRMLVVDIRPNDPEAKDWIHIHMMTVKVKIW